MSNASEAPPIVRLKDLAAVYLGIGIFSFGGGLVSWVHREVVERRQWVRDQEFLSGLALSQILPGPPMVSLSLYLGIQLRGAAGAAAAWSSLVLPPTLLILVIYTLYAYIQGIGVIQFALDGVAAMAVGLNLATGVKVARRGKDAIALLIAAAVFAAVAVLHWPMLWVVLGAAPISLAWAWWGRGRGG